MIYHELSNYIKRNCTFYVNSYVRAHISYVSKQQMVPLT